MVSEGDLKKETHCHQIWFA